MVYLGIVAALIVLIIIYIVIESTGFKTVTYELVSEKVPRDLKIAMLSDLHNKDFGNANEALLRAIDSFGPDLVCFSGDMVTSGWSMSFDYRRTLDFFAKVAAKYPVCYGLGNHEQNFKEDRDKFPEDFDKLSGAVRDMGMEFLDNSYKDYPELNTSVYGLSLDYSFYRRGATKQIPKDLIREQIGNADSKRFVILLAHNPVYFEDYTDWKADLVLSGHVHGGIVRLPILGGLISPGLKLFPKYDYGLFRSGKTTMIISGGIGSHSIPVRINNKAELVCISVRATGKTDQKDGQGSTT